MRGDRKKMLKMSKMDLTLEKEEKMKLPKVKWGEQETKNSWVFTILEVLNTYNRTNNQLLAIIIVKTTHEEISSSSRTFDLVGSIRTRRFRWLGRILRMSETKLVHKDAHHLYHHPTEGRSIHIQMV